MGVLGNAQTSIAEIFRKLIFITFYSILVSSLKLFSVSVRTNFYYCLALRIILWDFWIFLRASGWGRNLQVISVDLVVKLLIGSKVIFFKDKIGIYEYTYWDFLQGKELFWKHFFHALKSEEKYFFIKSNEDF